MRLDKFLAHNGYGTRKEVKALIKKKHIKVNEIIVKDTNMIIDEFNDRVYVDDEIIQYVQYVYLMLNKPAGYVCATKDDVHETVLDLITGYDYYELFPVGRLDKDTTGILLLTNDGDFSHKLMSPNRHHSKTYEAVIDGFINEKDILLFNKGVPLKDFTCKSAKLKEIEKYENTSKVEVTIYEGKFHQIKRMFIHIGKPVLSLHRKSICDIVLDTNLKPGEFRELTETELELLKKVL